VAAPLKKWREATKAARPGWFLKQNREECDVGWNHPGAADMTSPRHCS
jgi:hypothetical protein